MKKIVSAFVGVLAFLHVLALRGECYVHAYDWNGGYRDYSTWRDTESGFVVQTGGYYLCCQYTADNTGVKITGVPYSRDDDDGTYYYYPAVYSKTWDSWPSGAGDVTGSFSIPAYIYGKPVVEIGYMAFYGRSGLTGITIPSTVTNIEGRAFLCCSGLTSITIPSSVQNIGEDAFSSCSKLTSITIPNSVKKIGDSAFSYCSALQSVSCPTTVELGGNVFSGCEGLRRNGMIIAAGHLWDASKCSGDVVVPQGVRKICDYAFCHLVKADDWDGGTMYIKQGVDITSVTLPSTVTEIGAKAFDTCFNLKSINFPAGLKVIGSQAFFACKSLKQIDLPDGLEAIGDAAFNYCRGLSEVEIPTSVRRLGNYVLGNCCLRKLTLPLDTVNNYGQTGKIFDNFYEEEVDDYGAHHYWWYQGGNSSVAEIVLTNGSKIPNNYFSGCSALEKVTIPPSVTKIGINAFNGCTSLSRVDIGDINAWCGIDFGNAMANPLCYAKHLYLNGNEVTTLNVPSGLTEIKPYAFCNAASVTSVTIPSTVTNMGADAFAGCGGLTRVDISDLAAWYGIGFGNAAANPLYYAKHLFLNGEEVTHLEIPDSVSSIGDFAFYHAMSLSNVVVPSNVTSIGKNAFAGCSRLESIDVAKNNAEYVSVDGVLFDKDMGLLICCPGGRSAPYVVPSCVTNIGDGAFVGCKDLIGVTIPSNVTRIGTGAFTGCLGIRAVELSASYVLSAIFPAAYSTIAEITIPEGTTSIAANAYKGCAALTAVAIPSTVTSIGTDAFVGCTGIRSVELPASYTLSAVFPDAYSAIAEMTIPEGTTSIAANAYQGCAALTAVALPSSVTDVGLDAFAGCGGLTRVDISDLAAWYGIGFGNAAANPLCYAKHLFLNGSEITSLDVPAGLAEIRPYAFYNAALLTTVTIPSTMTSIGTDAFGGCTGIRSVELPASYTLSAVFPDAYSAIAEMTIPEGTTSIAANAYQGCSALTAVAIPSTVKSIGASAFAGCGGLTRVDISDLAAWYGIAFGNAAANPLYYAKHLFLNGSEITSLDVPAGLAEIRPYTFYNAASLTTVSIPSAVTSIGTDAFGGCTGIRTATIPSRFVLSSVFPAAYDKLTSLTLLGGETTVVANACSGCASLTSIEIPADVKTLESNAFKNCSNLTSVTFLGEAPACGDNVFAGTSPNLVVHAAPNSSGWMQWNGRPIAFDAQGGGSDTPAAEVTRAELTITNVMVCYIMNSVQPDRVIPASLDAGYVNILTEVKSGGVVSVPATWMVNYPNYVAKFGADFTQSLMKPTGKRDGMGNPMTVWQDYVAGTDPTDEDDVFTASITTDANGKLIISYTPELSEAEKAKRVYKTLGKVKLQDKDWVEVPAGSEGDYNFFKVTVEMK